MNASAQTYSRSFVSLELPVTAEQSALGGENVSLYNFNVDFFQNNPALSSDSLNGWASVNHLFYFAETGFSSFAYQHHFKRIGSLSFGVNHMNFGSLDGYDIFGTSTGTFRAGETTVIIGKSHQVNAFRFGINVKGLFSSLAGYHATALLADVGGTFIHPTKDFTAGLVLKNMGVMLSEFTSTSSSQLPFDIQLGLSFKPEHMPLRFSTTVYRLNDYSNPYLDSLVENEQPSTLDKVASHLTFGAELLIHKKVSVLFGYNFLKHKELKLANAGGGSGFSIGAIAKVKNFNFAFSRTGYVTGGAYQVTVNLDTKKIFLKK